MSAEKSCPRLDAEKRFLRRQPGYGARQLSVLHCDIQRPTLFKPPNWWNSEGPTDLFRDNLSSVFDLKPIAANDNTGICRARAWFVEGYLVSQAEGDATFARRNKWQAENCGGLIFVHRYLSGESRGVAEDLSIEKKVGDVFITDQSLQIELFQTRLLSQGMHLPMDLLGYDRARHDPFITFSRGSVIGDLINAEMDRLFTALFHRPEQARDSFYRLISCLKVAIGSDHVDGDVRSRARNAMADQICRFIERHLDAPDLSVDSVLRNFGVSRASLYRMFEGKGGVRQYISDRRLYRAIAEISEHAPSRGCINAASEKWGFSSAPNFNRAVKRRFGVTPGALIETMTQDPAPVFDAMQVRSYFA